MVHFCDLGYQAPEPSASLSYQVQARKRPDQILPDAEPDVRQSVQPYTTPQGEPAEERRLPTDTYQASSTTAVTRR